MYTFDVHLKSLFIAVILLAQCTMVISQQCVHLIDMFFEFSFVYEFHVTFFALELFQFYMRKVFMGIKVSSSCKGFVAVDVKTDKGPVIAMNSFNVVLQKVFLVGSIVTLVTQES